MILHLGNLSRTGEVTLEETITFNPNFYKDSDILKNISPCDVVARCVDMEEYIEIHFSLSCIVTLIDCKTLQPFDKELKYNDRFLISTDPSLEENSDEYVFIYKGNSVKLDDCIYELLRTEIPLNPSKE